MIKIHCIGYASNDFIGRKNNFIDEAKKFNRFDNIKIYSKEDLDENFKIQFNEILSMNRGGGYWIWKPQIIKQYLHTIDTDDILFYIDVGCKIKNTEKSQETFNYYLDIIKNNNFLRFAMPSKEKQYTNSKTLKYFSDKYNINYTTLAESNQLVGGIMAFKKCDDSILFINDVMKCITEDPYLITDKYNEISKDPSFIDHRHDQSLLSVAYKSLNFNSFIDDQTWSDDFSKVNDVPILAVRARW